MRPLSAHEILWVWEQAENYHPIDKALALLALACPERIWQDLAQLSVGQRDALLFTLRELTFGTRLDGFAQCPRCGEHLEFRLNVSELGPSDSQEPVEPEETVTVQGFDIQFRLPNSLDLAAAAQCNDADAARDVLVRRCLQRAREGDAETSTENLPEPVITELVTQMGARDSLADVQLDLHCPQCDHRWPVILDIVSFFWTEICVQAKRLLQEVHILARAYGWRETDILAMSAQRRRLYLEMAT